MAHNVRSMARSYRSVTQQSLHYLLRPHDEIPQQPVPHPAAWRGDELMRQGGWQYTLDSSELRELEAAVARARQSGKRLAELSAAEDLMDLTMAELVAVTVQVRAVVQAQATE